MPCLLQGHLEKALYCSIVQQAIPVHGEHRGYPNLVIYSQAHESAEQEMVIHLFHQLPFGANTVKDL